MIKLITGAPGTGKTAMAVSLLMAYEGKRPIFNMGIPELTLDHFETPPVIEWTEMRKSPEDETIELPYFTFPENAVIIIDEAQRVYRPRSAGTKVPPHVAAFETHRHTGVDFILITQSPSLLDSNIKRLVGQHVHIRSTSLGRYSYEWPECGEVDSKSSRDSAIKSRYKLPKKVFGLYKSAELHTKVSKPIHPGMVIFIVCILLFVIGGFYMQKTLSAKISPVSEPVGSDKSGKGAASGVASLPEPKEFQLPDFSPRLPDRPETAPAFDVLRQVKNMPRVSACIASASRCICYTQQGTRLDVTEPNCRRIANSGDFDYYVETPVQQQGQGREFSKPAPPVVDAGPREWTPPPPVRM